MYSEFARTSPALGVLPHHATVHVGGAVARASIRGRRPLGQRLGHTALRDGLLRGPTPARVRLVHARFLPRRLERPRTVPAGGARGTPRRASPAGGATRRHARTRRAVSAPATRFPDASFTLPAGRFFDSGTVAPERVTINDNKRRHERAHKAVSAGLRRRGVRLPEPAAATRLRRRRPRGQTSSAVRPAPASYRTRCR